MDAWMLPLNCRPIREAPQGRRWRGEGGRRAREPPPLGREVLPTIAPGKAPSHARGAQASWSALRSPLSRAGGSDCSPRREEKWALHTLGSTKEEQGEQGEEWEPHTQHRGYRGGGGRRQEGPSQVGSHAVPPLLVQPQQREVAGGPHPQAGTPAGEEDQRRRSEFLLVVDTGRFQQGGSAFIGPHAGLPESSLRSRSRKGFPQLKQQPTR